MDTYTFSLFLGGAGLATMAAAGVAHLGGGHSHSHGGHGHDVHTGHTDVSGHGIGHSVPHALSHSQSARGVGRAGHASHQQGARAAGRSLLLSLISPRILFALLLGFGATGIVLRPFLTGVVLLAAALAGAVALELAIVGPVWRFLLRFASAPAQTLEGSLMSEARASSGFDRNGEGLVAVEVDGHIVQCLGTLRPDDRALGIRVRAGDVVRIEEVDSRRQRCVVSYVSRAAGAGADPIVGHGPDLGSNSRA